jgi:hypothetical protein
LVAQAAQDPEEQWGVPNTGLPEQVEVQLVETLMGEVITEPYGCRQRGCAPWSAGHLGVVLQGAPRANPAERQGPAPVLTGIEDGSAAFGDDPSYLLDAVDGSVELRGNLLGAAHAVGTGASNSRG